MPDPQAELEISGSADFGGALRGKGQLTLYLSDAARAQVGLDYRDPDRILLSLSSRAGIRLSADDSLELSGGLSRDLVNQELKGNVQARLRLARDLDARLEQEFGGSGPKTSMTLRLRL